MNEDNKQSVIRQARHMHIDANDCKVGDNAKAALLEVRRVLRDDLNFGDMTLQEAMNVKQEMIDFINTHFDEKSLENA
jgi:hypothetical protein